MPNVEELSALFYDGNEYQEERCNKCKNDKCNNEN